MANAKTEKTPRKLDTAAPDAAADARTQATEYESIFGNRPLIINGVEFSIPPHPDYGMLDDEILDEYEEYKWEIDTVYEREPDVYIPEQHMKNDDGMDLTLPAETKRGNLLVPWRYKDADGKIVRAKPSYNVKVVQIALGEAEYKRLRDAGGSAADVWKVWGQWSLDIKARQQRDSFRPASPVDVAPVPQADSE